MATAIYHDGKKLDSFATKELAIGSIKLSYSNMENTQISMNGDNIVLVTIIKVEEFSLLTEYNPDAKKQIDHL